VISPEEEMLIEFIPKLIFILNY